MTIKELIAQLREYPQNSEVDIFFNPCKGTETEYDIQCNIDLVGDTDTAPVLIVSPKDKPSDGFETIEEIINENPDSVTIEINKNGMYIYSGGQLNRELDFKDNKTPLEDRSEDIIKRIIREL